MAETPVERLWAAIDRLTEQQRGARCREPARTPEERLVLAALNGPTFRPSACPACHGQRLQRWGMAGGLQRYRCTICLRTCNPLTGTPLARLRRRDLWLGHVEALADGASLRSAARRLGVHQHTTFRWRHRWLIQPARRHAATLRGNVAIAVVPFHETGAGWPTGRRVAIPVGSDAPAAHRSLPGRPASLFALLLDDDAGQMADVLLPRLDGSVIAAALGPLLSNEPATLGDPGAPGFASAARASGVAHPACAAIVSTTAARHAKDGRGRADRLTAWMERFRGVSTRYLPHYLGWRRTLERQPPGAGPSTWLRLAHGRVPTANVGTVDGAGGLGGSGAGRAVADA